MYSKIALLAAARVGQLWRYSRSSLSVEKKLSATALSQQSRLRGPPGDLEVDPCNCSGGHGILQRLERVGTPPGPSGRPRRRLAMPVYIEK